jgi:two-component system, response regulator PdtaR
MSKIVLVEDEFIIAMVLEKQLQKFGYDLAAKVTNGKDAIDAVKTHQPDLIIMDIKIDGDMDGVDAMNEIRKFSDVPVIYMSGNSDSGTRERASKTGPVDYMVKPIPIQELNNSIKKGLAKNMAG